MPFLLETPAASCLVHEQLSRSTQQSQPTKLRMFALEHALNRAPR